MPISAVTSTDFVPRLPNAAARIFAKRAELTGRGLKAVKAEAQAKARRAGVVNKAQLVTAALNVIRRGISNGTPFAQVQVELRRVLSAGGVEGVPLHRLRLIVRQSTLTGYAVARQRVQMSPDVKAAFPYMQYLTVRDRNVREEHADLHAKIFSKDDPIWSVAYPPWDYNCRCFVRDVTQAEVDRTRATVWTYSGGVVLPANVKDQRKPKKEVAVTPKPEFAHPRDQYGDAGIIAQAEPALQRLIGAAIEKGDKEAQAAA